MGKISPNSKYPPCPNSVGYGPDGRSAQTREMQTLYRPVRTLFAQQDSVLWYTLVKFGEFTQEINLHF